MFIHNHTEKKEILLADVNCIANKLAGAKLRIYLDIFVFKHLDRFHLREKKGCDVQNMVTTVIIRVGSDALWGPYSHVIYNCDILQNKF